VIAVGDDAERAGRVAEGQLRPGDREVEDEYSTESARDRAGAISQGKASAGVGQSHDPAFATTRRHEDSKYTKGVGFVFFVASCSC
jgi:hypothetical protein